MNKAGYRKAILDKIELLYRNFGNEWEIEDFAKTEKQKKVLLEYLTYLSTKGIILLSNDGRSFKILDIPSNHEDLDI